MIIGRVKFRPPALGVGLVFRVPISCTDQLHLSINTDITLEYAYFGGDGWQAHFDCSMSNYNTCLAIFGMLFTWLTEEKYDLTGICLFHQP